MLLIIITHAKSLANHSVCSYLRVLNLFLTFIICIIEPFGNWEVRACLWTGKNTLGLSEESGDKRP